MICPINQITKVSCTHRDVLSERLNSHKQHIERMHQQHAERVESSRRQLRAPRKSAHPITDSGVLSFSELPSTTTTMISTSRRRSGEPETSQEISDSEPPKPSPQPDMDRTELWFMGIDVDVPHFRCVQHNHPGYREFLRRTGNKVVHYEVQDVLRGISEAFVALQEARSELDPGWRSGDAEVSEWNLRLSR